MARALSLDDLALGHPALDSGHRRLVDALARVSTAVTVNPGHSDVTDALTHLAKVTRQHFAAEEAMMRRVGLPTMQTHMAAHRSLLIQLHALTEVIADGAIEADHGMVDFLDSWLVDHICSQDRDLIAFAHGRTHAERLQAKAANNNSALP